MFRVSTTPIIRSTQNCNYSLRYCAATSLQRAALKTGSCTVPEAVVTVLCTPDDECSWHPKHVEWTFIIIKRLLCVASRWTIIYIYNCPTRYIYIYIYIRTFMKNKVLLFLIYTKNKPSSSYAERWGQKNKTRNSSSNDQSTFHVKANTRVVSCWTHAVWTPHNAGIPVRCR